MTGRTKRTLVPYNETLTWSGRTFQLYRVESDLSANRLDLRYLVKPKVGYDKDKTYDPDGKLLRFAVDFELLPAAVVEAKAEELKPIADGKVVTIQPELPIRATVSLEATSPGGPAPLQLFAKSGELAIGGPIQIGPVRLEDKDWIDHLTDEVQRQSTRIQVALGFRFQTERVASGFVRGATVLMYDRVEDVTGVDPSARPVLVNDGVYRDIRAGEDMSRYLAVEAKLDSGLSEQAGKTLLDFLNRELATPQPSFDEALKALRADDGAFVFGVSGLRLEMKPDEFDNTVGDRFESDEWRSKQIDSVNRLIEWARESKSDEEFEKVKGSGEVTGIAMYIAGVKASGGYDQKSKSSQLSKLRAEVRKDEYSETDAARKVVSRIQQELKNLGTDAKPVRLVSRQDRFLADSRTLRIEEILSSRTEVVTASDPAFPLVPGSATTSPVGRIVKCEILFTGHTTNPAGQGDPPTKGEVTTLNSMDAYESAALDGSSDAYYRYKGQDAAHGHMFHIVVPQGAAAGPSNPNGTRKNIYAIPYKTIGIRRDESVVAAFFVPVHPDVKNISDFQVLRAVPNDKDRVINPDVKLRAPGDPRLPRKKDIYDYNYGETTTGELRTVGRLKVDLFVFVK